MWFIQAFLDESDSFLVAESIPQTIRRQDHELWLQFVQVKGKNIGVRNDNVQVLQRVISQWAGHGQDPLNAPGAVKADKTTWRETPTLKAVLFKVKAFLWIPARPTQKCILMCPEVYRRYMSQKAGDALSKSRSAAGKSWIVAASALETAEAEKSGMALLWNEAASCSLLPERDRQLLEHRYSCTTQLAVQKALGNVKTKVLKANLYILMLVNTSFFYVVHVSPLSEDLWR